MGRDPGSEECRDQGAQKRFEQYEKQAKAVTGGGEDGVGAVAVAAPEIIAVHTGPALMWPITASTAARRLILRRINLVVRRTWPEIQTLNLFG